LIAEEIAAFGNACMGARTPAGAAEGCDFLILKDHLFIQLIQRFLQLLA
jgi:hypothetical protein